MVPSYDSSLVTHIVTETHEDFTLRALRLKSLSEIPDHIPIVVWSWVTSGNIGKLEPESKHEAFKWRWSVGTSKASKQKEKARSKKPVQSANRDWEFSRIE